MGVALGFYDTSLQTGFSGFQPTDANTLSGAAYEAAGAFDDGDGLTGVFQSPFDFYAFVDAMETKDTGISGTDTTIIVQDASVFYAMLGGTGDDVLTAEQSASGDGVIWGRAGDDSISIAAGSQTIDGGAGFDSLSFADASTGVLIDLGVDGAQAQKFGSQTLSSIERVVGTDWDDTLTGGDGHNVLVGRAGQDHLDGAGGSDRLIGRGGNDILTSDGQSEHLSGGHGADTFLFETFDAHYAGIITDLNRGLTRTVIGPLAVGSVDLIDVSAIDADTTTDGDQDFTAVTAFDGHAGEMVAFYKARGDRTQFLFDTDGDGVADGKITAIHGDYTSFHNFAGVDFVT